MGESKTLQHIVVAGVSVWTFVGFGALLGCNQGPGGAIPAPPSRASERMGRRAGALLADGSVLDGVTITYYTLALEASLTGQTTGDASLMCDPPNLSGCYHKEFLCSGYGVAMQGTGLALDGKLVKYVGGGGGWAPGYTWLNDCSSATFGYADAVRGASGRVLEEDYSIAVDPTLIPLGWYVWIESQGHWFRADDTGGGIQGKHIDIYEGASGQVPVLGDTTIYVTSTYHAKGDPSPFAGPPALTAAPSNLWPSDWASVQGTPVVLSWSVVDGAQAYDVHVRVFHAGAWRYYASLTSTQPSIALDVEPLPPATPLAFAVRATGAGTSGPLSGWSAFVVQP